MKKGKSARNTKNLGVPLTASERSKIDRACRITGHTSAAFTRTAALARADDVINNKGEKHERNPS